MTLIATHCVKDMIQVDGMDVASEAIMAIEALFLLINSEGTAQKQATMKTLQVFMKMRCFIKAEHVHLSHRNDSSLRIGLWLQDFNHIYNFSLQIFFV